MKLLYASLLASSALLIYIDHRFALYILIAVGLPILFYHKRAPFRVVIPYIFIEEALAYLLGGGLHGEAHSLLHDYLRSVPVFLTHYYLRRRAPVSKKATLYGAGSHGIVREILYAKLFGLAAILFIPPVIVIYGMPPMLEKKFGRASLVKYRRTILVITTVEGIILAMLFP